MSNLRWERNRTKSSWYFTDGNTYGWGCVAIVGDGTYGVFVRHERFEPMRWVTHVNDLEEAKGLVQTLIGARHES